MIILEKGEKADPLWGMDTEFITDEEINALKEGKRLYMSVNDEYAMIIKYKKVKDICKRIKKQTELTDLISRADAMGAVQDHFDADGFNGYDDGQKMMGRIMVLPSSEAPPYCVLEPGSSFRKPKTWHEKNSHTYICGDCGFEQAIYGNINEYNCCPRCGVYKEYVDYGCIFPQKRTPYREDGE